MILNKIVTGHVSQQYDTETGEFISQEFIANGITDWEFSSGFPVLESLTQAHHLDKASCATEMKQPGTSKAKYVTHVKVIDPDEDVPIDVTIFKEEAGGMGGVDSSYLANDIGPVYSPHGNGKLDGI